MLVTELQIRLLKALLLQMEGSVIAKFDDQILATLFILRLDLKRNLKKTPVQCKFRGITQL